MSGHTRLLSKAEVVADVAAKTEFPLHRGSPLPEILWFPGAHRDREEKRLQARARRQALALMVASSVIMILVLYGACAMLHGLIAGMG